MFFPWSIRINGGIMVNIRIHTDTVKIGTAAKFGARTVPEKMDNESVRMLMRKPDRACANMAYASIEGARKTACTCLLLLHMRHSYGATVQEDSHVSATLSCP